MNNKYRIEKPCSENWNNMTPTEKGRFCDQCQLEVLDLTRGQDVDLSQGRVCGRVSVHKRNEAKVIDRYQMFRKAAVWVPLVGSLLYIDPVIAATRWHHEITTSMSLDEIAQDEEIRFSGVIRDDKTNEPLPFVSLMIETDQGVRVGNGFSDIDGNYSISFETDSLRDARHLVLKASYVGYNLLELTGISLKSHTIDLKMQNQGCDWLIGIVIEEPRLIDHEPGSSGSTYSREDLQNSPYRE